MSILHYGEIFISIAHNLDFNLLLSMMTIDKKLYNIIKYIPNFGSINLSLMHENYINKFLSMYKFRKMDLSNTMITDDFAPKLSNCYELILKNCFNITDDFIGNLTNCHSLDISNCVNVTGSFLLHQNVWRKLVLTGCYLFKYDSLCDVLCDELDLTGTNFAQTFFHDDMMNQPINGHNDGLNDDGNQNFNYLSIDDDFNMVDINSVIEVSHLTVDMDVINNEIQNYITSNGFRITQHDDYENNNSNIQRRQTSTLYSPLMPYHSACLWDDKDSSTDLGNNDLVREMHNIKHPFIDALKKCRIIHVSDKSLHESLLSTGINNVIMQDQINIDSTFQVPGFVSICKNFDSENDLETCAEAVKKYLSDRENYLESFIKGIQMHKNTPNAQIECNMNIFLSKVEKVFNDNDDVLKNDLFFRKIKKTPKEFYEKASPLWTDFDVWDDVRNNTISEINKMGFFGPSYNDDVFPTSEWFKESYSRKQKNNSSLFEEEKSGTFEFKFKRCRLLIGESQISRFIKIVSNFLSNRTPLSSQNFLRPYQNYHKYSNYTVQSYSDLREREYELYDIQENPAAVYLFKNPEKIKPNDICKLYQDKLVERKNQNRTFLHIPKMLAIQDF